MSGRLGVSEAYREAFWARRWAISDDWESEHANDAWLWSQESAENVARLRAAEKIGAEDPQAAFRLRLDAAESGSAWGLNAVARAYWCGWDVEADPAKAMDYAYRAVLAGSWMATIDYARLLNIAGHWELAEQVLEQGVSAQFVPAFFWLGFLRVQHEDTRRMRLSVLPLMQHAVRAGHPMAALELARWMAKGEIGVHRIPAGMALLVRTIWRYADDGKPPLSGAPEAKPEPA